MEKSVSIGVSAMPMRSGLESASDVGQMPVRIVRAIQEDLPFDRLRVVSKVEPRSLILRRIRQGRQGVGAKRETILTGDYTRGRAGLYEAMYKKTDDPFGESQGHGESKSNHENSLPHSC